MQFTSFIIALLPALVAAETISSDRSCAAKYRDACPASTDGLKRCAVVNGENLCVIDCGSQSACRTSCIDQKFKNGFCTTGKYPCICNNNNI